MHKDEWKDYSSSFEAGIRSKENNTEDDKYKGPSP